MAIKLCLGVLLLASVTLGVPQRGRQQETGRLNSRGFALTHQNVDRRDLYSVSGGASSSDPVSELFSVVAPPQQRGEDDPSRASESGLPGGFTAHGTKILSRHQPYLTPPSLKFKIGVVSEEKESEVDTEKGTKKFISKLREGYIHVQKGDWSETHNISIDFDDEDVHELWTRYNKAGRGLELSTLNVFNGKLYACDDSTGIVFEIIKRPGEDRWVTEPWVILTNHESDFEGFKCEWATVKDNHLWVGSHGFLIHKKSEGEGPTSGPESSGNKFDKTRQFVKKINVDGQVSTLDWGEEYERMAEAVGINLRTGYVDHEAGVWDEQNGKWFFFPRRISREKYDKETDFTKASNIGIISSENFEVVKTQTFGKFWEKSGFTSAKLIPGTQLVLVLKVNEEQKDRPVTYLSVFDLQGKEAVPETKIADGKYSAVEFL